PGNAQENTASALWPGEPWSISETFPPPARTRPGQARMFRAAGVPALRPDGTLPGQEPRRQLSDSYVRHPGCCLSPPECRRSGFPELQYQRVTWTAQRSEEPHLPGRRVAERAPDQSRDLAALNRSRLPAEAPARRRRAARPVRESRRAVPETAGSRLQGPVTIRVRSKWTCNQRGQPIPPEAKPS